MLASLAGPLGRLAVFGPLLRDEELDGLGERGLLLRDEQPTISSERIVFLSEQAAKCGSTAARNATARIEQFEYPMLDRRACLPGIIRQVVESHDLAL